MNAYIPNNTGESGQTLSEKYCVSRTDKFVEVGRWGALEYVSFP